MARGGPSMTALLALLAVAGYQNRDRLAELFGRVAGTGGRAGGASPGGAPADPAPMGGAAPDGAPQGGAIPGGVGGFLSEGLRDLVDRFRQAGHGETAESWVRAGPNRDCSPEQVEAAIGPETMSEIARQTGLTREEILARLCRDLPDAVDRYTPEGRLPQA